MRSFVSIGIAVAALSLPACHESVAPVISQERWRSAAENYVSEVKPENVVSLKSVALSFAIYINQMHARIHPIFSDEFLEWLDDLPETDPLNNQALRTRLEIVLTADGHLRHMGIVKSSGVTAFDILALEAVHRAQPFGPAPKAIRSSDGNVYLHWELHRDETRACTSMNARPYLLNLEPPKQKEGPVLSL
jgi:TonB family protein